MVKKSFLYSKILIVFTLVFITTFFINTNNMLLKAASESESSLTKDIIGVEAGAAILIDADTGQILLERNADQKMGIASITKMMTEYLVLDAIEKGTISWDQEILIDPYVHELSGSGGLSNIGLTEGEKYTIKNLYEAMTVFSGNAASVALAQVIAGSESNFINLMNKKAEELNLTDFYFVNSSGLNNADLLGKHPAGEATDENEMSAHDVAKLAYKLLKDHPSVLETSKIEKLKFVDGKEYPNFNWMLPGLTFGYEGVDGLKTGTTDYAGACFVATASKNGKRFISVVLNTESKNKRFIETKKILDYAFATYKVSEVFPAKQTIDSKKYVNVNNGKEKKVGILTTDPISILVSNGVQTEYKVEFLPDEKIIKDNVIEANNQKKGTVIGKASLLTKSGEEIRFIDSKESGKFIETDVKLKADVPRANFFVRMWRSFMAFFK